jgi:predicted ferric reductase
VKSVPSPDSNLISGTPVKNIKLSFWALLIGLNALWLAADSFISTPYQFFALRSAFIYYSGIMAIGVMSVAMILAVRPVIFEPYLGGLDKMYRLHKWLGITGLLFAIIHWLWMQGPKWLVSLGWIERPARHGSSPETTSSVLQFFHSQRGLAESIGEWAFYAAVILIVLALVKRFPYRYFFKTHRLLALVYLGLVFHSVVLMKFSYWNASIGYVMGGLMAVSSLAALGILFGKVRNNRRSVGLVEAVNFHHETHVLEVAVQIKGRWNGHLAGQFAFVTFDESEGPHPFTLTSAWQDDGRMTFIIKGLGDYTRKLPATLKAGDPVKVEGPYGQFNFSSNKPRQIWIGGGIGITPFIARLKRLASKSDGKIIDLFYSTTLPDENIIRELRLNAMAAKVHLHILVDAKDGLLDVERICQVVPKWHSSDIWFCGPGGFGKALKQDFCSRGLDSEDFHQELFDLR